MQPAIFLDRDGVIIENRPAYVRSWEDVSIFPSALNALIRLAKLPLRVVIVTNQAGIGRGFVSLETVQAINARLTSEIHQAGGRIDGLYLCPHRPEDNCPCRKPRPGMLLRAAQDLEIDLPASVLIGDALTDLGAGRAAGLTRVGLVRTGLGAEQLLQPAAHDYLPFPVYDDLAQAVRRIFRD
jgi:histidinol-phosphate phosphatase family protein